MGGFSDLILSYLRNKRLTPIFLFVCLYPYTMLVNSSLSTESGRPKYIFIDTQLAFKHFALYRTLVGPSVYLTTHKAIRLYTLYRAKVSLTVRNQSVYLTHYI